MSYPAQAEGLEKKKIYIYMCVCIKLEIIIAFRIALIPLGNVWIQLFYPPAMRK